MKKVLLMVLVLALMAVPVYADQVQKTLVDATKITKASQTIEDEMSVSDCRRVSFFILNDSSIETEGVTCGVTVGFSYDGINWTDAKWFDFAGGTTAQSSESLGTFGQGDGYYYGWFDNDMAIPMIRFRITLDSTAASGIGASEYNEITVTVIEDK